MELIKDKQKLAAYCAKLHPAELAHYYFNFKMEDQKAGGAYAELLDVIHDEICRRNRKGLS